MSVQSDEWNRGRDWQAAAMGWHSSDQDPQSMGLFVVRDRQGNVEVATWLCDWNGKNGEWTRELRDVDRDNIVAWLRLPDAPF